MDFELSEEQRLLKDSVERLTDAALRLRGAQEIHEGAGRLEPRAVEAVCRARPHRAAVRRGARRLRRRAGRDHDRDGGVRPRARAGALSRDGGARRRLPAARRERRRDAATCCRRSRPARRCSPSRTPSGSRATTSPTSRRRRRRTAPATCSTARRASCCTATVADKLIVSARVSGDQRSQERHRAVPRRRQGRRRVAPRLSDHGRPARRRDHARRTSRSAPTR